MKLKMITGVVMSSVLMFFAGTATACVQQSDINNAHDALISADYAYQDADSENLAAEAEVISADSALQAFLSTLNNSEDYYQNAGYIDYLTSQRDAAENNAATTYANYMHSLSVYYAALDNYNNLLNQPMCSA